MRVTRKRREVFLSVLRDTGSVAAAARAASPHARGRKAAVSSFKDLASRDPDFAVALTEAKELALGRLEAEAVRRAVDGVERPIFQHGELVGHERVHSDRLLELLLRARAPETYAVERHKVDVTTRADQTQFGVLITPMDLLALSSIERRALGDLLKKIAARRQEPVAVPAPAPSPALFHESRASPRPSFVGDADAGS